MVCASIGSGFACGPPPGVYRRKILFCGPCQRRHRFIMRWDGAWYGTTLHGACGDRWMDGEMAPRPFEPGWRKKAKQNFREMWKNAAPVHLYDDYVRADCDMAVSDDDRFEAAAQHRRAAQSAIDAHREVIS